MIVLIGYIIKKKTSLLHEWFTSCCENVIRDKKKIIIKWCKHTKNADIESQQRRHVVGGRNRKVSLVSVSRLVLNILLEKILKQFID